MGASGIRRGNPRAGACRRRLRGAAGLLWLHRAEQRGGCGIPSPRYSPEPLGELLPGRGFAPRQEDGGFPQPSCSALDLAGGGNR